MALKVYISGMSGNKEVKKRQQRVLMILDSKHIKYNVVDITEPGKENEKEFMQTNSTSNGATVSDPDPRHALPPQIFNEQEYCGDYDAFDLANEIDTLEQFLKLVASDTTVVSSAEIQLKVDNGEVKPEDENNENKENEKKQNGSDVESEGKDEGADDKVAGEIDEAAAKKDEIEQSKTDPEKLKESKDSEDKNEPEDGNSAVDKDINKADNEAAVKTEDETNELEETHPEEIVETEEEEENEKNENNAADYEQVTSNDLKKEKQDSIETNIEMKTTEEVEEAANATDNDVRESDQENPADEMDVRSETGVEIQDKTVEHDQGTEDLDETSQIGVVVDAHEKEVDEKYDSGKGGDKLDAKDDNIDNEVGEDDQEYLTEDSDVKSQTGVGDIHQKAAVDEQFEAGSGGEIDANETENL